MKIIAKQRGQGKTTELIRMSANTNLPIMVLSTRERENVCRKAYEMGLSIPAPIIYDRGVPHKGKVLIDEIDNFLWRAFDISVYAATTPEVIEYTKYDVARMIGKTIDDFEIIS